MTFFGKPWRTMDPKNNIPPIKIFIPWIYLSNEVWFVANRDCMPKLRPREVETPIYPNGAHSFGASSPRVRVSDV